MKTLILTIVFFGLYPAMFAQSLRPEIQNLADILAKEEQMEDQYVYYPPKLSEQYAQIAKLSDLATVEELTLLTQSNSPIMRCIAFKALCKAGDADVIAVVESHIHDTSLIGTLQGCIGSTMMVGDYFIHEMHLYLASRDSTFWASNDHRLIALDSILFYDPTVRLAYKASRLRNINCEEKYYDRVRHIAQFEYVPISVLTLAKYQKQQDIQLIQSYLKNKNTQYYAIWAVREFPDSSFYPFLTNIFDEDWRTKKFDPPKWRLLYQALAQYPNTQTLKLFDKTIEARSKYRKEMLSKYVLIATKKYPHPIFEKYKGRILLDKLDSIFLDDEINAEL